jgi:1-acyl-sn-glycerol-3-phosphate acyltransferase
MDCDNNLFREDCYDTAPETPRYLIDRLLFGCRYYFYLHNFHVFLKTALCASKGELDKFKQIAYSNENVRLTEGCGGIIHLRGLDNLRSTDGRPVILIGNHMSLLETALFHAIVRPHIDFTFVIKKSLMDIPYFGDIMRALDAIAISRKSPRDDFKKVLTKGQELLDSGRSIILFPQSTRSERFSPEHFNSMGLKLAIRANVEVIPFALKTDFISNGKIVRDLGPIRRDREIHFEFGKPFKIDGNGKAEHNAIVSFISSKLNEWDHEG